MAAARLQGTDAGPFIHIGVSLCLLACRCGDQTYDAVVIWALRQLETTDHEAWRAGLDHAVLACVKWNNMRLLS